LPIVYYYLPPSTPTPIPITGVDDMGRPFTIPGPPQRIVSHVPSITETLFALGLNEKIAGVSDYCNYPEEAQSKPKIGGYFTPSIEAIVGLDPDLVLTDGYVANIAQLEPTGIPFIVIQPMDIDWIFRDIELLGNITDSQQTAEEITDDMRNRIDAVIDTVGNATIPRVFYVFDATDPTKPWTAGPGSFVNDLIEMAGGENIAAQAPGPWVQFSMEELINSDPEIILVDSMMGTAVIDPEVIQALEGWKDTTAAQENRIHTIDGDLVNRTGPRIVQGLGAIAAAIHPELFGP
jgi:iron complex transport system substrate-binding protein